MTAYNHEKYVDEAISSILAQTYENFELIIVDDGSSDRTLDIVNSFSDSRIKVIAQERQGPSEAFNTGIKNSTGEYVAFMSGDDVSIKDRLAIQGSQINLHKADIIFSLPRIIGPRSEALSADLCPWFFDKEVDNTAQIYRELFYSGNFFCAPSAFVRKKVIDEIGFFSPGLIQLQDFDYWVRAIKKRKTIKLFTDPVIKYRFLFGENLSAESNVNRLRVETLWVYGEFFNQIPADIFKAAFSQEVTTEFSDNEIDRQICQSLLLFNHPDVIVKFVGAKRIIEQLSNRAFFERYSEISNFSLIDFFNVENLISLDSLYPIEKFSDIKRVLKKLAEQRIVVSLSETKAKKAIQENLENGNNEKAVALVKGLGVLYPRRTILQTFSKIGLQIWRMLKKISSKIIKFVNKKVKKIKRLEVYSIASLYDYSKKYSLFLFEDIPEQVYLGRPEIIGESKLKLSEGKAICPKPYISRLSDVIITGGSDYVITKEQLVLNDELADYPGEEFGIKPPFVKFRHNDKLILGYSGVAPQKIKQGILISSGHDSNYFHWMLESLPKFQFVDTISSLKDIPLLIPNQLHKNLEAALKKCNLHNHEIIRLNIGDPYHVDELIFPSALSRILDRYKGEVAFDSDIVLSKHWIKKVSDRLKESSELSAKKPWRRLFLTRRKGARSVENIEEIEQFLLKYDFEVIELDNVSLDFQIELFSQALIIVSPTGAALTNLMFCAPNTKVLVFMSNHETSNYYLWTQLGDIMGLDVKILTGKRLYNLTSYFSVHDDYRINIQEFENYVSKNL
jgi:glycosyltransferase involved in cell wall biosynthesis